MFGPIHRLLVEDHRRLEDFLARVSAGLDLNAYGEFRITSLRYIEMEESIPVPALLHVGSREQLPIAGKLHLDHGALAEML
jgi:hypothetical protein